MSKRAVLFAGGNLYKMPSIAAEDLVIAIDSGLEHCLTAELKPHVVMGDFDSASAAALAWAEKQQVEFIPYPPAKDKTDTQLAVEHAIKLGAQEIHLYGALGSRFDHSLANVQLLLYIAKLGAYGLVSDGRQKVYLLQDEMWLEPEAQMCFSILPLTLELEGLTIRGARYPLTDAQISLGDTRTISNEFMKQPVQLSLKKGIALVFLCPDSL